MVAEHGSDPCLQEAVAEEATGDGGLGDINDSKMNDKIEAEGDCSGPHEACRIGFEMKQQNGKIVEMQEVETEKQVITLDMVYEKLQGLERMIDEACREKVMTKMDKVNAVASRGEMKVDSDKVEPQEMETAEESADTGRWTGGRVFH